MCAITISNIGGEPRIEFPIPAYTNNKHGACGDIHVMNLKNFNCFEEIEKLNSNGISSSQL